MNKIKKTHWRERDYRRDSLIYTIEALSNSIEKLKLKVYEIEWYNSDWLDEESEPIYGLSFIAFQNYINHSINDFFNNSKRYLYYNTENHNDEFTQINLIIALANYAKHNEELKNGNIEKITRSVIESYNLNYDSKTIDDSPILQGMTLLNSENDLLKIMEIVFDWRENLIIKFKNEQE